MSGRADRISVTSLGHLDDPAVERLLRGETPEGTGRGMTAVASFLLDVRLSARDEPIPAMEPRVAALIAVEPAVPHVATNPRRTARTERANGFGERMRKIMRAIAAILTGKLIVGAAIAVASVGGLQQADVIDIPGLPDAAKPGAVEVDEAPTDPDRGFGEDVGGERTSPSASEQRREGADGGTAPAAQSGLDGNGATTDTGGDSSAISLDTTSATTAEASTEDGDDTSADTTEDASEVSDERCPGRSGEVPGAHGAGGAGPPGSDDGGHPSCSASGT